MGVSLYLFQSLGWIDGDAHNRELIISLNHFLNQDLDNRPGTVSYPALSELRPAAAGEPEFGPASL